MNAVTLVSSNKSITTRSFSSGIQTLSGVGLKKRDAVKFFCELFAYRRNYRVERLT